MLIDDGLELVDAPEAMRLLAGGEVGRVGLTIGALPAIFPVNYRLVDGCIVFRSSPGSKLSAAARGTVVAFEVDDYNAGDRSGWSVLVVGPSTVVDDVDMRFKALEAGLSPYVDGHVAPSSGSTRRSCRPGASSMCPPPALHPSTRSAVADPAGDPSPRVQISIAVMAARLYSWRRPWIARTRR